MTFFDKKTEVMSIELTQYGKHLLSMGKFKPVYYEFFDNDIIYDSQYAGLTEIRNNIQERIKNETPYRKPQYVFSGIESNFQKLLRQKEVLRAESIRAGSNLSEQQMLQRLFSLQQTKEKIYFNSSPLGSSNIDDVVPSFRFLTHYGTISGSQQVKNVETQFIRIPEITMNNSEFVTTVYDTVEEQEIDEQNFNVDYSQEFLDGTRIILKQNSIILEVEELNTKEIGDNFEIEIFEAPRRTSSRGNQEEYSPLYFSNDNKDSKSVEYYFEINTDQEIDIDTFEKIKSSPLLMRIIQDINN